MLDLLIQKYLLIAGSIYIALTVSKLLTFACLFHPHKTDHAQFTCGQTKSEVE